MFFSPVPFNARVCHPKAVLNCPVVFVSKASTPTAVLKSFPPAAVIAPFPTVKPLIFISAVVVTVVPSFFKLLATTQAPASYLNV